MEQMEHSSNAELLSSIAGKKAAESLLIKFGGLTDLAKASFDDLTAIPGIGQSRAKAIKFVCRLMSWHHANANRGSHRPTVAITSGPKSLPYW